MRMLFVILFVLGCALTYWFGIRESTHLDAAEDGHGKKISVLSYSHQEEVSPGRVDVQTKRHSEDEPASVVNTVMQESADDIPIQTSEEYRKDYQSYNQEEIENEIAMVDGEIERNDYIEKANQNLLSAVERRELKILLRKRNALFKERIERLLKQDERGEGDI